MRKLLFCIPLLFLFACASAPKAPFDLLLGYDYSIVENEFNSIRGDFYNVKYSYEMQLNLGAGFSTRSKAFGQGIYVDIRTLAVHNFNATDYRITAISENFGALPLKENSNKFPTVTFFIPTNFQTAEEAKAAVKGDVITITVNDRVYRFVAPL